MWLIFLVTVPISLYCVYQCGLECQYQEPQFLGPRKVLEKEAIVTAGISSRAIGNNKHVMDSSMTAKYRIEVS